MTFIHLGDSHQESRRLYVLWTSEEVEMNICLHLSGGGKG